MAKKSKTETINNMVFHVPSKELICKKCGTTNYFYKDNKSPYLCDDCGADLAKHALTKQDIKKIEAKVLKKFRPHSRYITKKEGIKEKKP